MDQEVKRKKEEMEKNKIYHNKQVKSWTNTALLIAAMIILYITIIALF